MKDEISFYAHAARLHDIHLIGEIGFNAGHSAITMLYQTHHTKLISFDTMDLPWSTLSLEFVQGMYPHRVERVKGSSIDTVGVFAKTDERKFDLFCIDGMHSGVFPYQARAHCHVAAACHVAAWRTGGPTALMEAAGGWVGGT